MQVAITFTSSVRSGNLLSGFDETFETFRFAFSGSFEASCV